MGANIGRNSILRENRKNGLRRPFQLRRYTIHQKLGKIVRKPPSDTSGYFLMEGGASEAERYGLHPCTYR